MRLNKSQFAEPAKLVKRHDRTVHLVPQVSKEKVQAAVAEKKSDATYPCPSHVGPRQGCDEVLMKPNTPRAGLLVSHSRQLLVCFRS